MQRGGGQDLSAALLEEGLRNRAHTADEPFRGGVARRLSDGLLRAAEVKPGWWSRSFSHLASTPTQLLYLGCLLAVFLFSLVSLFAPLLAPACDRPPPPTKQYSNPDFPVDACRSVRYFALAGLTKWECDMCTRIIASIVCGSLIGMERRRADRPAGIRTLALICLGSCVFTVDSMFAFADGTMEWDASRVSAAIPSGVGFLGAASIWKSTPGPAGGSHAAPEVHGLTTATAVWLSAGVGIMCGGALYVPAFFACAVAIVYLRFAPRSGGAHHENLSPSHSADPIIAGSVDALPRRGLSIHS